MTSSRTGSFVVFTLATIGVVKLGEIAVGAYKRYKRKLTPPKKPSLR